MQPASVPAILLSLLLMGCVAHDIERENISAESFRQSSSSQIEALKTESPYLKVHMKNGDLYAFKSWNTDETRSTIAGLATWYNASRDSLGKDQYAVSLDSVALLETNVIKNSGHAVAITVFTGITAAVTI